MKQRSAPPKKNVASLRVGSLHANKEGRLFKVVRLASNKKVWRVDRAKPKPKPKKAKRKARPEGRALKGGDKLEKAKQAHMNEYHHMLMHLFCQISRMDTKATLQVAMDFFAKFTETYGGNDCFHGHDPFNKNIVLEFVTYLGDHASLDGNLGCMSCLSLLRSRELKTYIREACFGKSMFSAFCVNDLTKALDNAKFKTKKLIETDPEFEEFDASSLRSNNDT